MQHKPKIVILDGYVENPGDLSWAGIEALGELTVYDRCPNDEDEVIRRIGDAEILVANKARITRKVIESTNLKYITILATGYWLRQRARHSRVQRPRLRHRLCRPVCHRAAAGDMQPCGPPL